MGRVVQLRVRRGLVGPRGPMGDISIATSPIGGRISLVGGIPITESDVAGATVLYLVAMGTNTSAVFDGESFKIRTFADTVPLALSPDQHGQGALYDVFDYDNGSTIAIGTGPAWLSADDRGTGPLTTELELFAGRLVNKHPISLWSGTGTVLVQARRATFRATIEGSAAGQVTDSQAARGVSNFHNPVERLLKVTDPRETWTYSGDSFVIAGAGNGNNCLRFLNCVAGRTFEAKAASFAQHHTTDTVGCAVGIGIDQYAVDDATFQQPIVLTNNVPAGGYSEYVGSPGVGRHLAYWLEVGAGTGTQTWYGTRYDIISGIRGRILA